jgi:hypothetical protein
MNNINIMYSHAPKENGAEKRKCKAQRISHSRHIFKGTALAISPMEIDTEKRRWQTRKRRRSIYA